MRCIWRFQTSAEPRKIIINLYLFLLALYVLLASAHLINILIGLTVAKNVGLYFEIINAQADRSLIYILNLAVMLYGIRSTWKAWLIFPFLIFLLLGYAISLPLIDVLLILVSFFAAVWLLTNPRPFQTIERRRAISIFLTYLILILTILEFLVLICWFIFPVFPELSQKGVCKRLVDLETKFFLLTGCFAPLLTILLFFSWLVKLFFLHYSSLRKFSAFFARNVNIQSCSRFPSILLMCSVILSFLVVFYPYMPGLNVDMHPIGVDVPFYERWLIKFGSKDLFSAIAGTFAEYPDRPLSLLILYFAGRVSGLAALTVVQLFPIVLAPILTLSVYFFMRKAEYSGYVASFAAFLTITSFYVSVGLYGFFLSNLMALVELYLFMRLYYCSLRKRSYLGVVITVLLSVSLLFTHSWTWGMVLGVLVTYLILTIVFGRKSSGLFRLEVRFLAFIILINLLVGIMRNYVLGWSIGDFETLKFAEATISVGALGSFWNDLLYILLHTMYGFFVNPAALALAALGGFIAAFDDKPVNRYLTSWLIISCPFFILGSGWTIKCRILFNMPLPVFEALGLAGIGNAIEKIFGQKEALPIKVLAILFVLLVNLNYAFRCSFTMSQLTFD